MIFRIIKEKRQLDRQIDRNLREVRRLIEEIRPMLQAMKDKAEGGNA